MQILGIDIGGSGVKGALVDMDSGELHTERFRLPTPSPCTPTALLKTLGEVFAHFEWTGAVGIGFPGIIKRGEIFSAPNLHSSLVGMQLAEAVQKQYGLNTFVINDADAAATAEMRFGAGKGDKGMSIVVTVGTGLGSGMFYNGVLVPNIEFGHVRMKDKITGRYFQSEKLSSDAARQKYDLAWPEWASRFNRHLKYLCSVFSPDHIILGGGITKKPEKFIKKLKSPVPLTLAHFGNRAGIVGAAAAAGDAFGKILATKAVEKAMPIGKLSA